MKRATAHMRDFAKRLIALEEKMHKASKARPLAGFYVCEKLRPPLATLMGNAGFHSLLSRALLLAQGEVAWLRAVHVNADGSLDEMAELDRQLDSQQIAEGRVVLLAQLLGLLVAFIGEDLTMRLAREIWPNLLFDGMDFSRRPE
jgi:hypothetical protein